MGEKEPRLQHEPQSTQQLLDVYRIPYQTWGTGATKKFEDLEQEIAAGDAKLVEEKGELLRNIDVLAIDVFYTDASEQTWYLRETKQEFIDGRVRQRNLSSSLGEKIKQGEDLNMAAARGIQEELGQPITEEQLQFQKTQQEVKESESFPGLQTLYNRHCYECFLRDGQVELDEAGNPQGFVEEQSDKKTFFEWEITKKI